MRWVSFCLVFVCFAGIGLGAQEKPAVDEWRRPYHTKPLAEMTREELRAYKASVEKRARELGIFDDSTRHDIPLPDSKKRAQTPQKRVPGTSIQYDTGVVIGTGGVNSQMLGNRFDTALNNAGTMIMPVENTGTITMITFNMVNTQFNSIVYSLYSNIMGNTAAQVTSMGISGRNTGLNTITFGTMTMGNYSNGSFVAGIWQFDVTMTALGLDSNSTGGQGFHAASLNDGAMGTMLTDIANRNAVFRVRGDVALPVELEHFSVE